MAEPQSHVTNMATIECMRDLGLEKDVLELDTRYARMPFRRYCHTFCGQDYFRSEISNQLSATKADYENASPCRHIDIPQNLLGPIPLKRAAQKRAPVRWNTDY